MRLYPSYVCVCMFVCIQFMCVCTVYVFVQWEGWVSFQGEGDVWGGDVVRDVNAIVRHGRRSWRGTLVCRVDTNGQPRLSYLYTYTYIKMYTD